MKHTKLFALLLAVVLVLAGCASGAPEASPSASPSGAVSTAPSDSPEPTSDDGSVTIVDMNGRTVSLNGPVKRVVALTAADCEILYALGAEDALVGRGEYCNYPEAVLDIPTVQSGSETNLEQILALEPQVVLMGIMDQAVEQVEALENAGIRVVTSNANDIAGTYTAIEMIGTLMGRTDEAAALIAEMQAVFDELAAKADEDGSKTVYFEVSPLEYGLWTAGSGTFMDELASMLGFSNAFADVEGWVQISEEQVLQRNPDYIVTITMYYGEGPTPEEEIAGRSGWESLSAVQNGAILNADSDEVSRPGPRLADAAQALYDFFYGQKLA